MEGAPARTRLAEQFAGQLGVSRATFYRLLGRHAEGGTVDSRKLGLDHRRTRDLIYGPDTEGKFRGSNACRSNDTHRGSSRCEQAAG